MYGRTPKVDVAIELDDVLDQVDVEDVLLLYDTSDIIDFLEKRMDQQEIIEAFDLRVIPAYDLDDMPLEQIVDLLNIITKRIKNESEQAN